MSAEAGAGRLGVVAGSSLLGRPRPELPGVEWIQRHDSGGFVLAHEIDHRANARRLADAGCDRVLAISSVGGLRPEHGPGTHLAPDDFISLVASPSAHTDARAHIVPGFDPEWRARVVEAWSLASSRELVDGGVYWQTPGPRLETPAEIRMAAAHADVVGMTLAHEAVACVELGLAYAAICVVDNLANGVAGRRLEISELERARAENTESLAAALAGAAPALAAADPATSPSEAPGEPL
ncbi:6-oxopurine nucleoside phosphorylase [Thermoleophilia bacterium SCSIO 60948]|nr:6-oxopurine nucleoside phosphorylase [Thermoleophilia bacterium SCSIO 60948]